MINDSDIFDGLKKLFESLSKGTAEDKILLQTIIQRSISRSPYPAEFSLLDWREHFELLVEKYKIESWWRDEDYPGSPRFDYDKFINNDFLKTTLNTPTNTQKIQFDPSTRNIATCSPTELKIFKKEYSAENNQW